MCVESQGGQPTAGMAKGFEIIHWLLGVPGIGNRRALTILNEWMAVNKSFADGLYNGTHMENLNTKMIEKTMGLNQEQKSLLLNTRATVVESGKLRLEKLLESDNGLSVITLFDASYPTSLKEIFDPPLVLYARGNVSCLQKPCIAIVGTRSPSPAGREVASWFASSMAARGYVVVSGMADGIDGQVHGSALEKGLTVGVLGAGYRASYIRRNLRLYEKMVADHLLIGEYPPEMQPRAGFFPLRNRIISGLSIGTVVIEAGLKSGALITARYAMEQGRNVYVVPAEAVNGKNKGGHALVREGAMLVDDPIQILEDLKHMHSIQPFGNTFGEPMPSTLAERISAHLMTYGAETVDGLSVVFETDREVVLEVVVEMVLDDLLMTGTDGTYRLKR